MRSLIALFSVVILIGFTSCNETPRKGETTIKSGFSNSGVVQEAIQTSAYTYCLIKEDTSKYWIAVNKMDVTKGESLYFNRGMEMKDFPSKELNRTFPSVFFVQDVSKNPSLAIYKAQQAAKLAKKPQIVKDTVVIEKAKGGISIAELYSNKANYAGKTVTVRGKVTKVNPEIMGKNWIHIQDGTDSNGNFDLTITTLDKVSKGAVVTFEGTITLNKDFGAGYFYPVIMEDAKEIK